MQMCLDSNLVISSLSLSNSAMVYALEVDASDCGQVYIKTPAWFDRVQGALLEAKRDILSQYPLVV